MYDKIAQTMNEVFGSSDMDAGLVESYLRDGNDALVSDYEIGMIEHLLESYL